MKNDHHQFRRRVRQALIKADKDAAQELKRIEDLVRSSEQRDSKGRLTPGANQARQAVQTNPFLRTTARRAAMKSCTDNLRKAEHKAVLAYQNLFICLEEVRYQAELLSAFDEPHSMDKAKADKSTNEGSAERITSAPPHSELIHPAADDDQKLRENIARLHRLSEPVDIV